MPIGAPGKEQFSRAIVSLRNRHIAAGIAPVILFRQELIANDELTDRGGMDDPTRDHFLQLLINCDRWRRRLTHNPDNAPLGDKIAKAIDANAKLEDAIKPFGGDDIQMPSGGLFDLPWALDGTDPDLPLNSKIKMQSANGLLLLGAVDQSIVAWTRLNSRDRTLFVTVKDSFRIYGHYQQLYAYLVSFGGDANRVDVAQVLPSQEPLGPTDSANLISEQSVSHLGAGTGS